MEKKTFTYEDIKYEHLLGHPYTPGVRDCASIILDFYRDNFGIEITNYARPDDWWHHGLNIYYEVFSDEGFRAVDVPINKMQVGDIMLMAFYSKFPNHAAIYVGEGQVIYHSHQELSTKSEIRGGMRDALLAIIRRPDIIITEPKVDRVYLDELLPPYWKQQVENDPNRREALERIRAEREVTGEIPA